MSEGSSSFFGDFLANAGPAEFGAGLVDLGTMVESDDQRILEVQRTRRAERLLHGDQFLAPVQKQLRVVDQRPQLGVGVQQQRLLADDGGIAAGDGGFGAGQLSADGVDVAASLEFAADFDPSFVKPAYLQQQGTLQMQVPVGLVDLDHQGLQVFGDVIAARLGVDLRQYDQAGIVGLAGPVQERLGDGERHPRRALEFRREPLRIAVFVADLLRELDLRPTGPSSAGRRFGTSFDRDICRLRAERSTRCRSDRWCR